MIRTTLTYSAVFLTWILVACTPPAETSNVETSSAETSGMETSGMETSSEDNVRLYVFDCGLIGAADISMFNLSNDETPVRELFVPCYLIEHPQGRLIWDAGLPLAMAGQGRIEQEGGVYMNYERSLIDQLADMGLEPADIELAAFSHMHYDHVGAANAFTKSTLLIQGTEHAAAFKDGANPYFQPDLYMNLKDSDMKILDGDHDVFGDGSVMIVSAPGHTPGHQVMLLRLANTGPLLLSGDLYHFQMSRTLRRAPTFNTDAEETLRSMDKVEALIEAEGATLWIEHEMALAENLKMAPAYYD
jgi:glyoxylase-like metal-dependent hydrolase (beta-lactamase superfamily II)